MGRRLGYKEGTREYITLPNGVTWFSVLSFLVICVIWVSHLVKVGTLREKLEIARTTSGLDETWTDQERMEAIELAEETIAEFFTFRTVLAFYPFVIMTRLFKAFSAQPRLSIVTLTLSKAFTDVSHFGLVFVVIFMAFCISGMMLFGCELEGFAEIGRAMTSTFMAMLGDADVDAMTTVGRTSFNVWFWAFIWLVNFILLNMLLAIIMDVHSEVKGSIGPNAETLVSQAIRVYYRKKGIYQGTRVGLPKILECLLTLEASKAADADGESCPSVPELCTVTDLVRIVPNLQDAQAALVLESAYDLARQRERGDVSLSETAFRIEAMERQQKTMMLYLETLVSLGRDAATNT